MRLRLCLLLRRKSCPSHCFVYGAPYTLFKTHITPCAGCLSSTMTGSGARGRSLKSWNEYVREDLAAIGHAYDWWEKCKDREQWKTIIQVLLNVPSLQDWKTRSNNISNNNVCADCSTGCSRSCLHIPRLYGSPVACAPKEAMPRNSVALQSPFATSGVQQADLDITQLLLGLH